MAPTALYRSVDRTMDKADHKGSKETQARHRGCRGSDPPLQHYVATNFRSARRTKAMFTEIADTVYLTIPRTIVRDSTKRLQVPIADWG